MDSARRIAHDLNNVAFVISGYAQQIEESLAKDHDLQDDVQQILAEIPRLTAIVDRIRSLDPADTEMSSDPMIGATPMRTRRRIHGGFCSSKMNPRFAICSVMRSSVAGITSTSERRAQKVWRSAISSSRQIF